MKKEIRKEIINNPTFTTKFSVKIKSLKEECEYDTEKTTKALICITDDNEGVNVQCCGSFSPKTIMSFIEGLDSIKKELVKTGMKQVGEGLKEAIDKLVDEEDK